MVFRVLVFCLAGLVIVGCSSGDGLQRVVLSGDVSYLGQPVDEGSIVFVPCDGTTGPSVSVNVVNGRYKADTQGGVPVGTYRVKILGYRQNVGGGRQLLGPAPPGGSSDHADAPQQYLPAKYNVQSQLKITVEAGSGLASRDFVVVE